MSPPESPPLIQPDRKKPLLHRPVAIGAAVWASAPWAFALVYASHPFGHADPFWLPAFPFVIASFIPMFAADANARGFPMHWVVTCSIFNLIVGLLIAGTVAALKREPNQPPEPRR